MSACGSLDQSEQSFTEAGPRLAKYRAVSSRQCCVPDKVGFQRRYALVEGRIRLLHGAGFRGPRRSADQDPVHLGVEHQMSQPLAAQRRTVQLHPVVLKQPRFGEPGSEFVPGTVPAVGDRRGQHVIAARDRRRIQPQLPVPALVTGLEPGFAEQHQPAQIVAVHEVPGGPQDVRAQDGSGGDRRVDVRRVVPGRAAGRVGASDQRA